MSGNTIAARIKLARKMAGLATQAALLERIPDWKPSRLGNYEAGISHPGPEDVERIAEAAEVSPCWLMFGHGPIRPNARDLQAIRHQNLSHIAGEQGRKRGGLARLARSLERSRAELSAHVDNPFLPIDDRMARRLEQVLDEREGWADEQHVAHDPVCRSFPDDLRELMGLYSALDVPGRQLALELLGSLVRHLSGDSAISSEIALE
jgi:transcriptional regulator with XRE-family HTH domain